jgi:hypothetical protein
MALASISGPDIGVSLVGVGWTSCSVGDAAPTTTMRPRTRAGLTLPSSRSENETVSIVPGGPWKSIHAPSFSNDDALTGWPRRRATTVASVSSPPCSYSTRCSTPPRPSGRLLAPASAPISRRKASPPSTLLPPFSLVSAVARTTLSARSTAVMRALSSRAVVCSVNWTS